MDTTTYSYTQLLKWGAVVFVSAAAIFLLATFLSGPDREQTMKSSLESAAASLADSGAVNEGVIRGALSSLAPSDPNYVLAHTIYSAAQFSKDGREGQLKAVQLVKERYEYALQHGFAESQAYTINQLVQFAGIAFDRKVTDEVFKGDFSSLYDPNNIPASLTRLTKKSIDVYPTSDAYLAYASGISSTLVHGYLGTAKITDEERSSTLTRVREAITSADALYERDVHASAYQVFGTEYPVTYFFSRGRTFGNLALVDAAYIADMEESFDKAVNASRGNSARLFVDGMLPYLYLTRALVTHHVTPEREDVVRASAAAVASIVQANPDATTFFVQYLRSIGRKPELGGLLTPEAAKALSDLDAGFKDLLIKAGWKLGA